MDNLSRELKEYTTMYSDILVGLHNDVKTYKNDVDTQKKKTNSALNKIEILSNSNKYTLEQIQEIQNEIISWHGNFTNEKIELNNELKVKGEFLNTLSQKLEIQQEKTIESITDNTNYFNDNLVLLENIKNNFNTQVKTIHLVDLELKTLKNKFHQETEKTNKKLTFVEESLKSITEVVNNQLHEQDKRLQIITKRMKINHGTLYSICFLIILVITIIFIV